MSKSRKSFLQKSTPALDTLLTIVEDNRKMYKRYLIDRVPTINVSQKGIHLNEATDRSIKVDTAYTFSNVPRFSH